MNTTPTVEQFLAEQSTEDDDYFAGPPSEDDWRDAVTDEPLISIAESLRRIAAAMGGETFTAELVQQDEQVLGDLGQAYDDLEAKHQSLYELLADVEKIVSKSTSKVSLDVKAAINAWKAPAVEPVEVPEPVPAGNAAEMGHTPPAHDAGVEEWALYAESLGHEVPGSMNRSQIRTLLGIEQPTS